MAKIFMTKILMDEILMAEILMAKILMAKILMAKILMAKIKFEVDKSENNAFVVDFSLDYKWSAATQTQRIRCQRRHTRPICSCGDIRYPC